MNSHATPSDGSAPATVHATVLSHLREKDPVSLDEHLRHERRQYDAAMASLVKDYSAKRPDHELLRELWASARAVLERRLAALLPVALYAEHELEQEMHGLARGLERRPTPSGYALWSDLPQFAAGWLGYVTGALLVRLQRVERMAPLLQAVWLDPYGRSEATVSIHGDAARGLGEALAPRDARWLSPAWEFITRSLEDMPWLSEHYPELVADAEEPRRSMAQFDLIAALAAGVREQRSLAYFTLDPAARDLAMRLHADPFFRQHVASVTGLPEDDRFANAAAEALSRASDFRGGDSLAVGEVARIIETGVR